MEVKKFLVPTIIVFVVISIYNLIFHGLFMENLYLSNSQYFRSFDEIQKHKYFMWVANLIYSFAFTYIYSKGHEKRENSIAQGTRYGLWVTLLVWVPAAIVSYTLFPFPRALQFGWLLGYTIQSIIAGMVVSTVFSRTK